MGGVLCWEPHPNPPLVKERELVLCWEPHPNPPLVKELPCTHKSGNFLLCDKTPPLTPPRKRGGELDLGLNSDFMTGKSRGFRMCVHRSVKERELVFCWEPHLTLPPLPSPPLKGRAV